MRVFLWAVFGSLGGGRTQAWDMLRLWLRNGLDVAVLQSGDLPDTDRQRLESWACPIFEIRSANDLTAVPGLRGAIVVGVCHPQFIECSIRLRELNCALAWVNTMTMLGSEEGILYDRAPLFDAYVFESPFQQKCLTAELRRHGFRAGQGFLIPGPLEFSDWTFAPRPASLEEDFVLGRLARANISKWSRKLWEIYGRVDHPRRTALLLGADDFIRRWLGTPPPWATLLPPCAISAQEFYRRVHCLLPIDFASPENWPRIGLEAMASGVVIVAPCKYGWCDMIVHGETGFLANNREEYGALTTALARDDELRLRIAAQARERLHTELAEPNRIWSAWEDLFHTLECR